MFTFLRTAFYARRRIYQQKVFNIRVSTSSTYDALKMKIGFSRSSNDSWMTVTGNKHNNKSSNHLYHNHDMLSSNPYDILRGAEYPDHNEFELLNGEIILSTYSSVEDLIHSLIHMYLTNNPSIHLECQTKHNTKIDTLRNQKISNLSAKPHNKKDIHPKK